MLRLISPEQRDFMIVIPNKRAFGLVFHFPGNTIAVVIEFVLICEYKNENRQSSAFLEI
jgi:hypothetical protein